MKQVMEAIREHPDLELQVSCSGTMLLEWFGNAINVIRSERLSGRARNLRGAGRFHAGDHDQVPGFCGGRIRQCFPDLKPDVVLLIGDCYEAFARRGGFLHELLHRTYLGGEVSGSIDESARHCCAKIFQLRRGHLWPG
jgi:hypothetical protein